MTPFNYNIVRSVSLYNKSYTQNTVQSISKEHILVASMDHWLQTHLGMMNWIVKLLFLSKEYSKNKSTQHHCKVNNISCYMITEIIEYLCYHDNYFFGVTDTIHTSKNLGSAYSVP